MVRTLHRLTARTVTAAKPGMHADGGGLWLRVQTGGRAWLFRYKSPVTGRERLMGLGRTADVPLARARATAAEARQVVAAKRDPLTERRAAAVVQAGDQQTFQQAAEAYIESQRPGWRNPKHAEQWTSTLTQHAFPTLGKLPVGQVGTEDVMRVLEPIWTQIPETASRVRGRVELVLDYAAAKGWRSGDNPARWRGHIAHMLPKRSRMSKVKHHRALPYKQIAQVMAVLAASDRRSALALRFLVLTAARSSEVRGATWSEIDLVERTWTVPGERMKAGNEHRVPLSSAALEVLQLARERGEGQGSPYVFLGRIAGCGLSDVAMSKALHFAAGSDSTVHGLRSTFRDWCGEMTDHPGDVAEMALAHAVRDKVEAAYRRGDLFEKRRAMMEAWAGFVTSK
ncbi:MAG: tyrosine-type recombinase/integrase [Janthinobacterium lividum]